MQYKRNRVTELSTMIGTMTNHDYDGDTGIVGSIHSAQARRDFSSMFVNNLVEFEHRDSLLITFEHEAYYGAYGITKLAIEKESKYQYSFNNYKEFHEADLITIENIKNNISIKIQDKEFSIIVWLINRLLHPKNFDETQDLHIFYDGSYILNKKALNKLAYKFYKYLKKENREKQFYYLIHELDKFFLEMSTVTSDGNPSFSMRNFAIENEEVYLYKENLLSSEPYLAFQQNMVLFYDFIMKSLEERPDNILKKVFDSGARLKSVQLLKAASNTGIPTDIYGKAFPINIKNSLLDGLTQKEYFSIGDSARLALIQRQESIPKGGELQRKFFFSTGVLKFKKDEEDCQKNIPLHEQKTERIKVVSMDHLKTLNHRYFIENKNNPEKATMVHIDIEEKDFSYLIGQEIELRTPIKCQLDDYGICKTCFGSKTPDSQHVGATLGSYIAEGIIQETLRTHHFGGAFITEENKEIQDIIRRSKIFAPDIINFKTEEDYLKVKEYLDGNYNEGDYELQDIEPEEGYELAKKIIVHNLPQNDDSVKVLGSIIELIDRNRKGPKFIDLKTIYENLIPVFTRNDILSVYFELILSLLFFDEDNILYRYSNKEAVSQIALKNVIERLDPKLSIFYNFSNKAISNVYKADVGSTTHMYNELLNIYN